MKNKIQKYIIISLSLLYIFSFSGCQEFKDDVKSEVAQKEGEYTVYYLNDDRTKMYSYVYESESTLDKEIIDELIGELCKGDYEGGESPVIDKEVIVNNTKLDSKGLLTVDFSMGYQSLSGMEELLVRAAVVKTLCQLPNINCVEFTISGQELMINDGNVVVAEQTGDISAAKVIGIMNDYDFVNNIGSEENTIQKDIIELYFANKDGTKLESSYVSIEYDATMSLEEIVVMQLIGGPITENGYPSLNETITINKISVKDKICYVDMSEEFFVFPEGVSKEVAVYSIVNSLVEINGISKVQISIEGDLVTDFAEDGVLERNLDIIVDEEM